MPLLEPVYDAMVKRSQGQTLWHADETRWHVFVTTEGKVGYRWYLWAFHARDVVIFILAAGRSHEVPQGHLEPVEGPAIMVVDRYKAYQKVDKVKGRVDRTGILLGSCAAGLPDGGAELARPRILGDGLGPTDRRIIPAQ